MNEWVSEFMSTWGETSTRITNVMPTGTAWSPKNAANGGTGGAMSNQRSQPHCMRPCCLTSCQLSKSFKRCLNISILLWNSVLKYSSLVFNILSLFSWSCQGKGNSTFPPSLWSSCGWTKNKSDTRGFPDAPVVRTPYSHCRGHGFNPWSGN